MRRKKSEHQLKLIYIKMENIGVQIKKFIRLSPTFIERECDFFFGKTSMIFNVNM